MDFIKECSYSNKPEKYSRNDYLAMYDLTDTDDTAPGCADILRVDTRPLERAAVNFVDIMGFGPAATEKKTLRDLDALRFGGRMTEVMFGDLKYRMYTQDETVRAERSIVEGCAKIVKFSKFVFIIKYPYVRNSPGFAFSYRSTVVSRQVCALSALIEIKTRNPSLADIYLTKNDAVKSVQCVHDRLRTIKATSTHDHIKSAYIWNIFYSDEFDSNRLNELLTQSRKALYFVEENQMNAVVKRLFEMGREYCEDAKLWEASLREFAGLIMCVFERDYPTLRFEY
jgi:hypothetical protein